MSAAPEMAAQPAVSPTVVRVAPYIIAVALFMANLDSTVLSTSLPAIATDLKLNPIHLKLALTSYLLAQAIFIPASGWLADRLGAQRVFMGAMIVFALGSAACGLSNGLWELVAARILQGTGGAMMVPVGRLVLLKITPKADLVGTMSTLAIPALTAPILGPLIGGFITTYLAWRWNFWINLPVAAAGIVLARLFIPQIKGDSKDRFDTVGFVMFGPGLALVLTGATLAGLGLVGAVPLLGLIAAGFVLLVLYCRHALAVENPLIDLSLLKIETFRAALVAGFLFRVGIGALPFLLPLLFQAGFGLSAFQSGMMTFTTGIGAMTMKTLTKRILDRWGFRKVLIMNAGVAAFFVMVPALFTPATPALVIGALLLLGGFSRSLQFTSLNAFAYADIPDRAFARATTFAAVGQDLSGSVGVALAALGLETVGLLVGGGDLSPSHFAPIFVLVALVSLTSILVILPLPATAGATLIRSREDDEVEPALAPARGPATRTMKPNTGASELPAPARMRVRT